MPLTDTAVRNAKPTDKPRKLAEERGLYLLINRAGKYWRFDYRFDNKRKTLALGVYPMFHWRKQGSGATLPAVWLRTASIPRKKEGAEGC